MRRLSFLSRMDRAVREIDRSVTDQNAIRFFRRIALAALAILVILLGYGVLAAVNLPV